MESDSENELNSETRSRNSSVSSTDESNRPIERDDFTNENQHPAADNLRRRNIPPDKRGMPKRRQSREPENGQPPGTIHYHGATLSMAASQGSLPVTVLIWGFAAARRVNLVVPDPAGNNPVHFAALAETPEVLGFLLQQTRGMLTPDIRLVDSRNNAGETPLLRSLSVGKVPVVKALLDEGSDPFAHDNRGQNAIIILARSGNLWCLHFYCTYLSEKFGPKIAWQMLLSLDLEGHGALDWAADVGSVSVLEYLIRKGLDPFRVDQHHRGPLYWSVKSRRLLAVRFLLYCGCDPLYEDNTAISPLRLAEQLGDKEMVELLSTPVPMQMRTRLPGLTTSSTDRFLPGASNSIDQPTNPTNNNSNSSNNNPNSQSNNNNSNNNSNNCGIFSSNSFSNFAMPIFSSNSNSSLNSPRESKLRNLSSNSVSSDVEMAVLNSSEVILPSAPVKLSVIAAMNSSSTNNSSSSTVSSSASIRESIDNNNNSGNNHSGSNHSSGFVPSNNSNMVAHNATVNSNNNTSYVINSSNNNGANNMSFLYNNPLLTGPSSTYTLDGNMIVSYEPKPSGLLCLWKSDLPSDGTGRKSKAIFRQNETRMNYMLCYALVVVFYWFLTLCIPWYAFLIFVGMTIVSVQQLDSYAAVVMKSGKSDDKNKSVWIDLVLAKERYVGLYVGTFGSIVFYCLYCLIVWAQTDRIHVNNNIDTNDYQDGSVNFLIGATSGVQQHCELFLITLSSFVLSVLLWLVLAWWPVDPGLIDTRNDDFDYIMQASLLAGGAPPAQQFCRSLLVRKPIRSKYCASTGLVIARMDHYCVWLNTSIGAGNHRLFMGFLMSHVTSLALLLTFILKSMRDEIDIAECGFLDRLLNQKYFYVTTLCAFLIVVLLLITVLLVDQCRNILSNVTSNEKINHSRYPWMMDEFGQPCNRFDRGAWANLLEFCQIPGYAIDYTKVFDLPIPARASNSGSGRNSNGGG